MSAPVARHPVLGPVLLALDTATERIHAALSIGLDDADPPSGSTTPRATHRATPRPTVRTTVLDLPGGAQASSTLLPALSGLLADAGLAWSNLDALAFGAGPGAFTGLRTACATVQGLALGLNLPVIPLDTLMAVAEDARLAGQLYLSAPVWALQDARMGELYAAGFVWDASARRWRLHADAQLWPLPHALGLNLHLPPAQWAGNAVQADADLLAPLMATRRHGLGVGWGAGPGLQAQASAQPQAVAVHAAAGEAAAACAAPRGQALASLARAAWARGEAVDAALALPRYVRDKVAQTTAERQQATASAAVARAS